MYEYLPHVIKEMSDTRRSELLREADLERLAKQQGPERRASLLGRLRTIVTKMLSL